MSLWPDKEERQLLLIAWVALILITSPLHLLPYFTNPDPLPPHPSAQPATLPAQE